MRRPLFLSIAAVMVLVGLLAACSGGNGDGAKPAPQPTTATTSTAAGTDLVAQGRQIYTTRGLCITCHANANVPGASMTLGPDHTHLATEASGQESGMSVEAYIRESITNPSSFTTPEWEASAGLMEATIASLNLSSGEVDALVAFLLTQK